MKSGLKPGETNANAATAYQVKGLMRGKELAIGWRAALAIAAVLLLVAGTRGASQEKVLHSSNAIEFGGSSAVQSASPESSPAPARPANKTDSPSKGAGIRSVDFRNFDYPSTCREEMDEMDERFDKVIHVKNGEWKKGTPGFQPSVPGEIDNGELYFRVDSVTYGDLEGNGQEAAVVWTGCGWPANFDYEELFIFAMSSNGPQLLARLSPSDWGKGEEDNGQYFAPINVHVSNRKLFVSFPAGGPYCCAKWTVTAEFEWNGKQFVRNGNLGLGIASDSYATIRGYRRFSMLRLECTQNSGRTEHQLRFSPGSRLAGYDPEFAGKGGHATFKMTIGGTRQVTTWVPRVERPSQGYGDLFDPWEGSLKIHHYVVNFTYPGSEQERWKFIQSLLNSESVSIEFTPVNGKPVTSVFDTTLLREGIEKHPQCAAK